MPINHRQVEVFRAIMQAGSVSAAAQMLHSSQPTLSRELALMERRLGYALFERGGSRLRPSAAGLALFDSVQRHYQGLAAVQADAQALAVAEAQPLQVLALPALAHALLPPALAMLRAEAGELHISPAEPPLLEAWMSEQRHDLALVEQTRAPGGCSVEPLAELQEVAVLPADHALAARALLEPKDFQDQDFVSLAADDPYRLQIDRLFAEAGVRRRLRLQTSAAVTVCALVAAGLGLAIVNPLTARACAADPRLVWRPLSAAIPYRVALLRALQRPRHRAVDALAAALRQVLAPLQAAAPS